MTWTSYGQDASGTLGVFTRVLEPDEYLGRQIWGLDSVGNWEASADSGTAQARTHNDANEITGIDGSTSLISHDAAGNVTTVPHVVNGTARTHTYDAWGRLSSTGYPSYRYDGLNRLVLKELGGDYSAYGGYTFYYNASWQLLETYQKPSSVLPSKVLEEYVWDLRYIDSPVVLFYWDSTAGTLTETMYYCNDANFNVTAVVTADGDVLERYRYDPYGRPEYMSPEFVSWGASPSGYGNRVLYAGYLRDGGTGLYLARNRYYHPTLGRWLQRDPIGHVDGMNLYEYVRGQPVSLTDPQGTSSDEEEKCCDKSDVGNTTDAYAVEIRYRPAFRKHTPKAIEDMEKAYEAAEHIRDLWHIAHIVTGGLKGAAESTAKMISELSLETVTALIKHGKRPNPDKVIEFTRKLENSMKKAEGVVIWIRVEYKECKGRRGFPRFWRRNYDWKEAEKWHECSAKGRLSGLNQGKQRGPLDQRARGFYYNDPAIVAALPKCLKEALESVPSKSDTGAAENKDTK